MSTCCYIYIYVCIYIYALHHIIHIIPCAFYIIIYVLMHIGSIEGVTLLEFELKGEETP